MTDTAHINSPAYWDQRFQQDWAANGGEAYTRAYAELCLEFLPEHLQMEIRRGHLQICDWGCAEGEAVSYFSQHFPANLVCGVDVSETAIANGRRKFPGLNFQAQDWLAPDAELPSFDIVFSSHVLEHFPHPMTILSEVLGRVATKMIIVLMPYAEDPAKKDPEHAFRFLDTNLPMYWEGWSCAFFRVFDTRTWRGPCWRGEQTLVVYTRDDWMDRSLIVPALNAFRGDRGVLQDDRDTWRRRAEDREKELLLSAKKLEVQFLHDQNFVRINESLRNQLATIQQQHALLKQEHALLKQEHGLLKQEHGLLKQEHALLNRSYTTDKKELEQKGAQIIHLNQRLDQLRSDLARLEQEYRDTRAILRWPPAIVAFYLRALFNRFKGFLSRFPIFYRWTPRLFKKEKTSVPLLSAVPLPKADDAPRKEEALVQEKEEEQEFEKPTPEEDGAAAGSVVEERSLIMPAPRKIASSRSVLNTLKMGVILDTFSYACFDPECRMISFRPDNWRQVLEAEPPDFLFVESAWQGNGSWQTRIASYASPAGNELDELLQWCNTKDIPTVFWNKEDPPNFDRFINAAVKFDYIFTTDENCVEAYRQRCGHDRVASLPFAAQPTIHHPVLKETRQDRVCFAGTYYADCFPERRRHMENMLGGSIIFGLDIYDRMFRHEGSDKARFLFPEQFQPYIRGKLSYESMLDAYRKYRVFLNVNSVYDSPTMFARRVFELLACGTPLVSTPSKGMEQIFGALVPQVKTESETRAALQPLMDDDREWMRRSALGIRRIMDGHCYRHRLQTVAQTLGLDAGAKDRAEDCVLLLTAAQHPERTAHELASQNRPACAVYILNTGAEAEKQRACLLARGIAASVISLDQVIPCLSQEHPEASLALIHGAHSYGPSYLRDGMDALRYSNCGRSGLDSHFAAQEEGVVLLPGSEKPCFVRRRCLVATLFMRPGELNENVLTRSNREVYIEDDSPCFLRYPFEFIANAPEVLHEKAASVAFIPFDS
ncbi:MAG: glycosyltransferase family protein [Candidatus Hydrogenedentales bacterium]|jgi:spore maturation protein CgeB/SAM-dependent methyltransferase